MGIESGGFMQGPIIAQYFGLPFIPIRRAGYLPGQIYRQEFKNENGENESIEI